MKSLGELIKELREKENMTQRRLAYELDLDVSVLSRIENENKFPKKRIDEIIKIVSRIFSMSETYLKEVYLSDEITSILAYEEDYENILRVSEEKIHYVRNKNSVQAEINFDNEGN